MLQLSPSTEQRAGPTAGTLVTVTDTEATATAAATWPTAAQLVTAIAAAAAAAGASRTNHHCVCVVSSALHTLSPVALPALSVEAYAAHHCSTL